MELTKQIEMTHLIYENLTNKKHRQAKEETLATIFGSVHDSDSVTGLGDQITPAPADTTSQTEQDETIQTLYENQEAQATDLQAITDNQNQVIGDVQTLHEQIADIKKATRNIIEAINHLTKEISPPEEPMPEIEPATKPVTTGKSTVALDMAKDPKNFKLEQ